MSILTRYLFREIINYFLIFIAIVTVILMVAQFYDSRSAFLQNRPDFTDYMLYIILCIPEDLSEVLPLIALISTMFSYGVLAKNKELLAMVAAGLSFRRLAKPALVFGLGITALLYLFSEFVVPRASIKARVMEQVNVKGRDEATMNRRRDVFIKAGGNMFLFMNIYQGTEREMVFPSLFEANPEGTGIIQRIEADRGVLVARGEEASTWRFDGVRRWQYNSDGTLRHYEAPTAPLDLQLGPELDRFLSRAKDPMQMNFMELREYVELMRKKGGERLEVYATSLQQKAAFPLACMMLALLGYAVVVDIHARRFAQGVLKGLVITVLFYVVFATFANLSKSGLMNPVAAGWLPLLMLGVIIIALLARLNRVRA